MTGRIFFRMFIWAGKGGARSVSTATPPPRRRQTIEKVRQRTVCRRVVPADPLLRRFVHHDRVKIDCFWSDDTVVVFVPKNREHNKPRTNRRSFRERRKYNVERCESEPPAHDLLRRFANGMDKNDDDDNTR